MSDWKAKLPKVLPDMGNAHYVFAIKTETGFHTEAVGTANAKKLMEALMEVSHFPKHKDGEPLLYERDGDSGA